MSSFKFGDIKVEGPAQFGDNAQMIVTWAATRASEIQHPRAEEIAPLLDKIAATVSADAESSPQKNSEKLTLLKEIREHLGKKLIEQGAEYVGAKLTALAAAVAGAPIVAQFVSELRSVLGF